MPADDEVVTFEPSDWITVPYVHGRTRDWKDVTLFDITGTPFLGPVQYEVQESYRVRLAVVGCHITSDAFTSALVKFDRLNSWSDAQSVIKERPVGDELTVRIGNVNLAEVDVDGDVVRLFAGVSGSWGDKAVHVDRDSCFDIKLNAALTAEEIVETRMRPLQDLLIFSLGRAVRLSSFKLLPPVSDGDTGIHCDAYFPAVQTAAERRLTSKASPWSYTEPTLLTVGNTPIAISELILKWYEIWSDLREVVVLLLAHHYAPFMYGENRFASIFQSAEAYHKKRFKSQELDKQSHKDRVAAVLDAATNADVDAEVLAWAKRVLQSRNDKPLWRRVEELIASTGAVGEAVLNASPEFPSIVTNARTGVSHGGSTAAGDVDSVDRYWHGEVLGWVIRARLLLDLGAPVEDLARRVADRAPFRYAVDQIRVPEEEDSAGESSADQSASPASG
jgi:hypothetical protein